MSEFDFKGLNAVLLARAGEFLLEWLPGGRIVAKEYTCGDIHGGPGDSLKFNILKGYGSDFATGEKFADMIDLYAKIENISMGEAYKKLAEKVGFDVPEPKKPIEHVITAPPTTGGMPNFKHHKYGEPVAFWAYKNADGATIFYVARYETATGKEFLPFSWSETFKKWVCKGQSAPRPLYGLDRLADRPNAPVMICEGEGCADAAEIIAGGVYVCVSWTNGSKGVSKADWKPLWGRKVLIWPDNDDPGMDAGFQIAKLLDNHCPEVKIIKPYDQSPKWDAADALAEGWNWAKLLEWAKPRAEIYLKDQPLAVKPVPFNEPEPIEQPQPEQPEPQPEPTQPETVQASVVAKTDQNVAVANVSVTVHPEDPISTNNHALWEAIGLIKNGNGTPHMNIDNALRIIEAYEPLKGMVWFDDFHQKLFTTSKKDGKTREWSNVDTLKLTSYMQRNLGMPKISDEMIYKACTIFGHRNMRNEPQDWMNSLVWDGTERIANFFCDALGVPEMVYAFAASRNFWIGMVARILQPGCKMDNMVVLEGPQGIFKSSALEVIGGKWYASARGSVLEKDFFLTLHGKMIIEIAELSSFRKAEITAIKQVITCRTDRYRTPYDRTAEDHLRQCVFAGTTNENEYLDDKTGGRRFWPIVCGKINLNYIRDFREQLFAEAVKLFKDGANWYEMPEEETKRQQELRRHMDEWETVIYIYTMGRNQISITDLCVDCLKIELGRLDSKATQRLGRILNAQGWARNDSFIEKDRNLWNRLKPESEQLTF